MAKKKTRRGVYKTYLNYVRQYNESEEKQKKFGYEMFGKKLTYNEYKMVRKALIEEGEKNVNRKIVSDQTYEYSAKFARNLRKFAKEHEEWDYKNVKYREFRHGRVDVSAINNALIDEHPDWTSFERANFITNNVFMGSK